MAVLDGVRIGPLDPDKAEGMGQVGGQSTARLLIRHHVAMHPQALIAALSRVRQNERSLEIDKDEAEKLIRKSYAEAGEGLPEDAEITGLAVRGDDESPDLQVVTFTYSAPSGRSGKGFVPYSDLPRSKRSGDEAVRVGKLKEKGLPWQGESGASAPADLQAENVQLRADLEELRAQLAGGSEDDGETPEDYSPGEAPAEPWEGYEKATAPVVRARILADRDPVLAQAVLAYEQRGDGGRNRSSVVSAANEVLDRQPAA